MFDYSRLFHAMLDHSTIDLLSDIDNIRALNISNEYVDTTFEAILALGED